MSFETFRLMAQDYADMKSSAMPGRKKSACMEPKGTSAG